MPILMPRGIKGQIGTKLKKQQSAQTFYSIVRFENKLWVGGRVYFFLKSVELISVPLSNFCS